VAGVHGHREVLDGQDVFFIVQFLDSLGGKGGRAQEGGDGEEGVQFHRVLFLVKVGISKNNACHKCVGFVQIWVTGWLRKSR
jgi:hypothetical protein